MDIEDIIPHLNRMSTLYLSNHKKKVGFLFLDEKLVPSEENETKLYTGDEEVCFVNVQKGRRLIQSVDHLDMKKLREVREVIPLREIIRIRSSK